QTPAARLAKQVQAGFAALYLCRGRNDFGEQECTGHQGQGDGPEGQQQSQTTDPRYPQNDQFVALGQAGQGQNGANQQSDGEQVIDSTGGGQAFQIKQIAQGEFAADVIQLFDQGEK